MSQVSQYRNQRPGTASPHKITLGFNSDHSENIKRFRSDFPNLPGFSRHSLLRPQSPKVKSNKQSLLFKNQQSCSIIIMRPDNTNKLHIHSISSTFD